MSTKFWPLNLLASEDIVAGSADERRTIARLAAGLEEIHREGEAVLQRDRDRFETSRSVHSVNRSGCMKVPTDRSSLVVQDRVYPLPYGATTTAREEEKRLGTGYYAAEGALAEHEMNEGFAREREKERRNRERTWAECDCTSSCWTCVTSIFVWIGRRCGCLPSEKH